MQNNLSDRYAFESDFLRYIYEKKHVMLMYENLSDYRFVAAGFIADGLLRNDRCIMVTDEYSHELAISDLSNFGVDVQKMISEKRLILFNVRDHYLSGKYFDPIKTMKGWMKATSEAVAEGFAHVRVVAEATFALEEGVSENLIYYENIINDELFPNHSFMSLCVYNKFLFSETVLKAAIQSHPMVVLGRKIFKNNIYYTDPEIFFSTDKKSEIDSWLQHVESNNELVQRIVHSEEKLELALDATDDGIWDYNLITGEFSCSDRWANMLGYEKHELPDFKNFCENNIHPEDKPAFDLALQNYLSGKQNRYEAEVRLKAKDGSYRWIFSRGKIVERNCAGVPVRVVGAHTDISARKEAEIALAESERIFKSLFQEAPIPYQSLDSEGNFITVNKVFCDTLGYTPDELIGMNFSEILHPDWIDQFKINFPRFKAAGEVVDAEFEMRKKNGEYITVSSSGKIGKDSSGSFRQTHCVFRDISAEKEYNESLIKAKEEAVRANDAKNNFLANMSHELRTPLNGVMGMLQLIQMGELKSEQYGYSMTALESCRRLTSLLGDILDISMIESGKIKIIDSRFELLDIFKSVEALFSPVANFKDIEIRFVVSPKIPTVLIGDDKRLHQIINNLVDNAIKFSNGGNIVIEASPMKPITKGNVRILFSVTDDGIGIADDKVDTIFENFSQADSSRTRKYDGAGLGLAIVKKIVGLQGGNISVESNLGEGTSIYFCLEFTAAASLVEEYSQENAIVYQDDFKDLNVLIVEDERVNQIILKKVLEKKNCNVTLATDGVEALDILMDAADPYNLIFMDIQMSNMGGVETTKHIRSGKVGEKNTNIPIVAYTAHAMAGDREEFLDVGMNGYLSKPIHINDVENILSKYSF